MHEGSCSSGSSLQFRAMQVETDENRERWDVVDGG